MTDVTPPSGGTEGEPTAAPSPPPPPPAPPPQPPSGAPPPFPPGSGYGPAAPPPGPAPSSYGSYGQPGTYGYGPAAPVDNQGRPLAGWWLRFGAIFVDGIILGILPFILISVFVRHATYGGRHLVAGVVIISIIFTAVDLAYFAFLNGGERGQTVGQMLFGIAVRDEATGGAIGPGRAALRIIVLEPGFILEWVPILSVLAGLYTIVAALSPLWDSRKQGFHDKVAHTFVIKVR
jgi:uncharacterized RDD family membrane protein YckC